MSRGINKAILIGNLGADPETRYTPSGTPVATVNLATTDTWRDKQSGEMQERTQWHRVVFFKRLAEVVGEYLRKGSKIYVEGRINTRDYEKDGTKHYITEIIANELQMLDGKPVNAGSQSSRKLEPPTRNPGGDDPGFDDDLDSDIPF